MTDRTPTDETLVERLRWRADSAMPLGVYTDDMRLVPEAADRIEQLERQCDKLAEALRLMADTHAHATQNDRTLQRLKNSKGFGAKVRALIAARTALANLNAPRSENLRAPQETVGSPLPQGGARSGRGATEGDIEC